MKKTFLLTLLFPLLHSGMAQPLTDLRWSESFEPTTTQHIEGLFGNHEQSFMVFTDREHSLSQLSLALVDASGQVKKTDHQLSQEAYAVAGAYMAGNKMVVLLEFQYEKEGQFIQEVRSLSFDQKGLTEEKNLLTHEARNKAHLGKIKFAVSPDKKHSMLFAESPFKTGANEEIRIFIFDAAGKEESSTFTLEIESRQNVHNYPQLANSGVVYFLKRDKDKTQQIRYYLYAYVPVSNNLSRKLIALPNTSISDIRGTVTPQGEFIVGGFTSSENLPVYEGYFLLKFDQSCMQKFKTQANFDETSFLRFLSKKEYSKNPVIPGYFIENIVLGPTGRIYITAEAYQGKETFHQYKDVMLVCFNENGEYKTTFRVNKNQGIHDGYTHWASYKTFGSQDSLVVLYNDMVHIEGTKTPEPLLKQVKVHEKANMEPALGTSTFDAPRDTPFFNPDIFMQEGDKQFTTVFSDLGRKRFRLARADL